jgi:hypothetical protein
MLRGLPPRRRDVLYAPRSPAVSRRFGRYARAIVPSQGLRLPPIPINIGLEQS